MTLLNMGQKSILVMSSKVVKLGSKRMREHLLINKQNKVSIFKECYINNKNIIC